MSEPWRRETPIAQRGPLGKPALAIAVPSGSKTAKYSCLSQPLLLLHTGSLIAFLLRGVRWLPVQGMPTVFRVQPPFVTH